MKARVLIAAALLGGVLSACGGSSEGKKQEQEQLREQEQELEEEDEQPQEPDEDQEQGTHAEHQEQQQPPPEPEETDSPDPKAHMQEHLAAALKARDAVISGDLAQAKQAVSWLSSHIYPDTLPPAWRSHAERMQAEAKRVEQAPDLGAAAAAIGVLGGACGACHAHVGGPAHEPMGFESDEDGDLPDRMDRHAWAMDRMWEGLITPWEEAFRVGAEVLAEGRFRAQSVPERATALAAGLERARALGREALAQKTPDGRAAVYGKLLAQCAQCHTKVGVKPL